MSEESVLPVAALPLEPTLDSGDDNCVSRANDTQSRSSLLAGNQQREFSREQWAELKPIIRRLYVDENLTREDVTKYIAENFEFRPTKRQFNRKISEWGFEKNTKKAERVIILENVKIQNGFETMTIRGRKLGRLKLERWRKLDGVRLQNEVMDAYVEGDASGYTDTSFNETRARTLPKASFTSQTTGQTPVDTEVEETVVDAPVSYVPAGDIADSPDMWQSVNIVGSPRLSGFFGRLTLYECEPFSLDCSVPLSGLDVEAAREELDNNPESNSLYEEADSEISTAIVRSRSGVCHRQPESLFIPPWATHDRPTVGLSPFPTPTARTNSPRHDFSSPNQRLRLSEAECLAKMRRWSKMSPTDILDLADSMDSIATGYCNLYDYRSAELWYRRIIRCKRHVRIRHLKPTQTITSCLHMIDCLSYQGIHMEARKLHQDLHTKILRVFPDHQVSIELRIVSGIILGSEGYIQEEEAITRELLQITLSKYGATSFQALDAMTRLGNCLTYRKLYSQSERLIRTVLQLERQVCEYVPSPEVERNTIFDKMCTLLRVLNRTKQLREAEQLLRHIRKSFPDLSTIENRRSFHYHFEMAEVLRSKGHLAESEKTLLDILLCHGGFLDPNQRADVLLGLAKISEQTDRGSEAVSWYKEEYDLCIKTFGLEHKYSLWDLQELGFCYANQGLFDDAVALFEGAISKIESSRNDEDESPNENVEKIRGWTVRVETDRCKKVGFNYVERGLIDKAILHFQKHVSKLEDGLMGLILGAVNGLVRVSAKESIKRVKRWMSLVRTDQCKAIGFRFADKGHVTEALSYFQQVEAELAKGDGGSSGIDPGSCAKSIKRVRRWISIVVDKDMANCKNTGFNHIDKGQYDEAILHFQQEISRFTEAEIMTTNSDIYHGCVERIQRWLSTAYALKSLGGVGDVGMAYADDGSFDQAIQHFQQAMNSIDLAEEHGTHDPEERKAILQYWIQCVAERKARSFEEIAAEYSS